MLQRNGIVLARLRRPRADTGPARARPGVGDRMLHANVARWGTVRNRFERLIFIEAPEFSFPEAESDAFPSLPCRLSALGQNDCNYFMITQPRFYGHNSWERAYFPLQKVKKEEEKKGQERKKRRKEEDRGETDAAAGL